MRLLKQLIPTRLRAALGRRIEQCSVTAAFDDAYFDWVYIDGNPLYEFVLRDLELYYPRVKSGGALLGDDYTAVGWWEDGVTRAVDAFVAEHGLDLTVIGSQFHIRRP